MNFSIARPDVIRAINQRWLLNFWQRHLGADCVPRWQGVRAEELSHVSDTLSLLDVVGGNGALRFQIRFHGETVGRVFGSRDCRGLFLHEGKPEPARSQALAPYRQAVAGGWPVYLIHDIADRQGRLVHYERLLLPFTRDGATVDRVLTSFEFVCPDGAFDTDGIMEAPVAPSTLRLSATIAAQAPPLTRPVPMSFQHETAGGAGCIVRPGQ